MPPPDTSRIDQGATFVGETIRLDGRTFIDCTFRECVLEIGGSAVFHLERPHFRDCDWVAVDSAAVAIVMLARLYQDHGVCPLVDTTLEEIRSHDAGPLRLGTAKMDA
jgi:hypothetical protein